MGGGLSSANVLKQVNKDGDCRAESLKKQGYTIRIDRKFNMADSAADITGALLSQIETQMPLNTENNARWVTQQIIHAVFQSRMGLNDNEQIATSEIVCQTQGDKFYMSVNCQTIIYGKGGEWLSASNYSKMLERFIIGMKFDKNDIRMDNHLANLLQLKSLSPDDAKVFNLQKVFGQRELSCNQSPCLM